MVINLIWIKRKDCISHLVRVWSVSTLVWVKTLEHNLSEPDPSSYSMSQHLTPLAIVLSWQINIFAKLWLLYLSSSPADSTRLIHHSSLRRRQKVQCDQWKEPSFQCLHKVTTKYFQPLAITRTHSTWNILTSKHLLQSFQDKDYTLRKPETIDIAGGFCQNTLVSPADGWGYNCNVLISSQILKSRDAALLKPLKLCKDMKLMIKSV